MSERGDARNGGFPLASLQTKDHVVYLSYAHKALLVAAFVGLGAAALLDPLQTLNWQSAGLTNLISQLVLLSATGFEMEQGQIVNIPLWIHLQCRDK